MRLGLNFTKFRWVFFQGVDSHTWWEVLQESLVWFEKNHYLSLVFAPVDAHSNHSTHTQGLCFSKRVGGGCAGRIGVAKVANQIADSLPPCLHAAPTPQWVEQLIPSLETPSQPLGVRGRTAAAHTMEVTSCANQPPHQRRGRVCLMPLPRKGLSPL